MSFLLDTNIILRMAQPSHPMCADAFNALSLLRHQKQEYYLTQQILIEFWRTATRPVQHNGLGMSILEAETELQRLEKLFPTLADVPEIYGEWRRLVIQYSVMGVNVHDARLVAAMRVHRVSHILTFNIEDFKRYAGEITSMHPGAMAA